MELIKFEETFVGSTILLIIIFGILLTILLWLRRLSYVLPSNEFSQNNERHQREYYYSKGKETPQEVPVSVPVPVPVPASVPVPVPVPASVPVAGLSSATVKFTSNL
uniref:Wsv008 n=1 Tax=Loa loa TaxID=7209 RepID=A0A1I7VWT3_LOALO